jgi:hypothetical protein
MGRGLDSQSKQLSRLTTLCEIHHLRRFPCVHSHHRQTLTARSLIYKSAGHRERRSDRPAGKGSAGRYDLSVPRVSEDEGEADESLNFFRAVRAGKGSSTGTVAVI